MDSSQQSLIANFLWRIADDVPRTLGARTSQQQLRADFEARLDGFSANAHDDAEPVRREARA